MSNEQSSSKSWNTPNQRKHKPKSQEKKTSKEIISNKFWNEAFKEELKNKMNLKSSINNKDPATFFKNSTMSKTPKFKSNKCK